MSRAIVIRFSSRRRPNYETNPVRILFISLILLCVCVHGAALNGAVAGSEQALLWPDGAPGAEGGEAVDRPALTLHLAAPEKNTGAAVVVNPGGGYRILASDHEGLQVARWLNSIGVNAFVLRYRLMPKYASSFALLDGQRAVRYVRSRARELGIDPNRIGMLGFSAGGHLTTAVGTAFDDGDPKAADAVERVSSRPDFLVPIYAVVSGNLLRRNTQTYNDTAAKVTAATPPAFLVHTHTDPTVTPRHSIAFYQALLAAGVPAEMHIFALGPHGVGLAPGDPDLGQWPGLLHGWLRRQGLLSAAERVEVSGAVLLDGEPLYWGWLTLLPEDGNNPPATAYMGRRSEGKFKITADVGPSVGPYRLEVHRVSTDFSDPTGGAYSIDDAEKFTKKSPQGNALVVQIAPGVNKLKIEIATQ